MRSLDLLLHYRKEQILDAMKEHQMDRYDKELILRITELALKAGAICKVNQKQCQELLVELRKLTADLQLDEEEKRNLQNYKNKILFYGGV